MFPFDRNALATATGKAYRDWMAHIAAHGANTSVRSTAEWLMREHGLSHWWAFGLAAEYHAHTTPRGPGPADEEHDP